VTTSTTTHQFAITATESSRFAQLSGDFNPLHLDATVARRTQFGSTVVHGIHLLLQSLDAVAGDLPPQRFTIASLAVTFSNPMRTGGLLQIRVLNDDATGKIRITGESEGRTAFTAKLEVKTETAIATHPIQDLAYEAAAPRALDFPPSMTPARTALRLNRIICSELFPRLGRLVDDALVADLLATTRIVGMECPGLDSIYSAAKFQRRPTPIAPTHDTMDYQVNKLDDRFRMIRVAAAGAAMEGIIEAFFRPRPVQQKPLAELVAVIEERSFSKQLALIIGGSRGLGELTAKILLAGGAKVTLTYSSGRDDAKRIADEAGHCKRECVIQQLDMRQLTMDSMPSWLQESPFTHVYYFASPHITKNLAETWNQDLFERYAAVYVQSFAVLAESLASAAMAAGRQLRFFYPSSVFVDQPEKGFAEYAAAKSAGEELCRYLAHRYGAQIALPRLPRVRTDQTSGLTDAGVQDAFPIMAAALRALHL